MKFLFVIFVSLLFYGCSIKHKNINSAESQQIKAEKAWNELDQQ